MICGDCIMQRLLGLVKIMYVRNNMVSENFQQYNLERKITQRYAYINLVLRVSNDLRIWYVLLGEGYKRFYDRLTDAGG